MKRVSLVFYLLFLFSCSNETPLKGIWIGDYEMDSSEEEVKKYPHNILLDFSDDTVKTKILQYWASKPGSDIGLYKEAYSLDGNILTIDSTQAKIQVESDSLVITYVNNENDSYVFKRLGNKNSSRPKVDLSGKAFTISGLGRIDSVDFINDSLYIDIYNDSNSIGKIEKWSIAEYGPFSFLLFDKFLMPSILINQELNNEISLTGLFKKEFDIEMTPIDHVLDTTGLNGKWFFPPRNFPPPPMFEIGDSLKFRTYLTIKNDTLEIKKYRSTFKTPLYLNSTREYIWLGTNGRRSHWKIINIEDNLLTISKPSRTSRGDPATQFQIFERVKTSN